LDALAMIHSRKSADVMQDVLSSAIAVDKREWILEAIPDTHVS